jgi:hypothetical protein
VEPFRVIVATTKGILHLEIAKIGYCSQFVVHAGDIAAIFPFSIVHNLVPREVGPQTAQTGAMRQERS